MTARNIGSKIINIGKTALLPDMEMTITKGQAETPAIKAFVSSGFLIIIDDEKPARKSSSTSASTRSARTSTKTMDVAGTLDGASSHDEISSATDASSDGSVTATQ